MLTKADAVIETEPLILACLFKEESALVSDAAAVQRRWRLDQILPMDAVGDVMQDSSGALRLQNGHIVCAPLTLRLTRDEAQGYYLNLESPEPSVFFLLRFSDHPVYGCVPDVRDLTLSYEQAARWMDGGEQVERIAAPAPFLGWLAEFTEAHFEVPVKKVKNKNRPSFMSRDEFNSMVNEETRLHRRSAQ